LIWHPSEINLSVRNNRLSLSQEWLTEQIENSFALHVKAFEHRDTSHTKVRRKRGAEFRAAGGLVTHRASSVAGDPALAIGPSANHK
jgi:hypothetical protein